MEKSEKKFHIENQVKISFNCSMLKSKISISNEEYETVINSMFINFEYFL
jgi:hypothetical protein